MQQRLVRYLKRLELVAEHSFGGRYAFSWITESFNLTAPNDAE